MRIMEIDDCIRYIERNIESGNNDLIISTEFGKLVIEVNYEDYGPETRVLVDDWNNAPPTRFNMVNLNCKADYFVVICNPSSKLSLHLRVVEAMYRVMFKRSLNIDISDDVADAAILIHRYEKEGRQLTANMLYHDFCKYNLNMMVRNNDMVQWLVRDHVERRLSDAKKIVNAASNMLDNEIAIGSYRCIYIDNYSRQIFGLLLYVSKELGIDLRNRFMVTTRGNHAFITSM